MKLRWAWLIVIPAVHFLFFFRMGAVGLLGPDEPRYASIGREMAASGDLVTPRLWGQPWFEKPALLYWLIALGFRLGLSADLAPRLPIAFLSCLFLAVYCLLLRRLFEPRAALCATAILATSAAWIAFSHVAVTDLPLAAAFSAAMLVALQPTRCALPAAGVLLGLAMLAKGLVPVVLSAPLLWFFRHRWRQLAALYALAALTAAPWYLAVTVRHGAPFWDEFLWKHHFSRFATDALQHQQPFWFYLPVLAGALFPWTPLLLLLRPKALSAAHPNRVLLTVTAFGLLFFSASTNKLPGYLLPLLPLLCAVLGNALSKAPRAPLALAASAALLVTVPLIADILPFALEAGLSRAPLDFRHLLPALPLAALAFAAARLPRAAAVLSIAAAVALSALYLKIKTYPVLDQRVSARGLWRSLDGRSACAGELHRSWRYGLNYYSVTPLPDCEAGGTTATVRILQTPGQPPRLEVTSSPSASSLP